MVVELRFVFSLHGNGSLILRPSLQNCLSSVQFLHDLISMTLMKGSGLFDEVDGFRGLL